MEEIQSGHVHLECRVATGHTSAAGAGEGGDQEWSGSCLVPQEPGGLGDRSAHGDGAERPGQRMWRSQRTVGWSFPIPIFFLLGPLRLVMRSFYAQVANQTLYALNA